MDRRWYYLKLFFVYILLLVWCLYHCTKNTFVFLAKSLFYTSSCKKKPQKLQYTLLLSNYNLNHILSGQSTFKMQKQKKKQVSKRLMMDEWIPSQGGLVIWLTKHWSSCVLETLQSVRLKQKQIRSQTEWSKNNVSSCTCMGVHMSGVVCIRKIYKYYGRFCCRFISSICVCVFICMSWPLVGRAMCLKKIHKDVSCVKLTRTHFMHTLAN